MNLKSKHSFSVVNLIQVAALFLPLTRVVQAETYLAGDHFLTASNVDYGNFTIQDGELSVYGNTYLQSDLYVSNIGYLLGGVGFGGGGFMGYVSGSKTAYTDVLAQDGAFLWRDIQAGSTMHQKMGLDANNVLTLYKSDNSGAGITLNPNTGAITSGGSPLATQSYVSSAASTAVGTALGSSIAIAGGFVNGYRSVAIAGGFSSGDNSVALATGNTSSDATGSVAMAGAYVDGEFAVAGAGAIASGQSSASFAQGSATGHASVALAGGQAGGILSVAGSTGTTYGINSTAFGGSLAVGNGSFSSGAGAIAYSMSSVALGQYNLLDYGTSDQWLQTEILFALGNGPDDEHPSNAISTLKNGQTTLTNRHWTYWAPTALPADPVAGSGGKALVVEGHTELKGNTRLEGQVIITQVQGDVGMGIYQ